MKRLAIAFKKSTLLTYFRRADDHSPAKKYDEAWCRSGQRQGGRYTRLAHPEMYAGCTSVPRDLWLLQEIHSALLIDILIPDTGCGTGPSILLEQSVKRLLLR